MKSCRALVIILLAVFFWGDPVDAWSQCPQRIATKDIKIDKNSGSGSFKLVVNSNSGYRGEVIQLNGTHQSTMESFSGNRSSEFTFSKLELGGEVWYRAVIEFNEEDGILCRKKYIDVDFKSGIN